ncbi:MarR family winged helix-turn-helix transcriptional regulator [Shimazuella kribbensis]|uniref:MarR family winged helix-turn-helix transcriptional regulator n=1 Tax=Shimazuella kribbensis TaxID=139808 RepID=UPI0004214647|nr:MarR family transcriptional regulator [Shimazuella kribbensis]
MIESTDHQIGHWVRRLNHALIQSLSEALKPYELGHSQWQVLSILYKDNNISIKKLREQLNVESGTLTGVIDALIRKGWVIREEDPKDRRMKQVKMTEEGKLKWSSLPNPRGTVKQKLVQDISKEDMDIAINVLKHAYKNLTAE